MTGQPSLSPDPSASDLTQSATPAPSQSIPQRLGDFRIEREIGRGGMGVVYEALQESLGRRVALKILPQGLLLGEQQRLRFAREARAAAQLHHTNIVPIFGIGEQQGISYYIMQLIDGQPLDKVIDALRQQLAQRSIPTDPRKQPNTPPAAAGQDHSKTTIDISPSMRADLMRPFPGDGQGEKDQSSSGFSTDLLSLSTSDSAVTSSSGRTSRSTYFRSVARIGRDVAAALQHAFEQKVVHRDIKPANLILDNHGTIWITDFGLARIHEAPAVTQPGDVVGTLRYMAAEALEGKGDVRADICSLGLTLYELLVLRPAHDAGERRQLLNQISRQSPVPLRKINPRIPRDLETIISKAIAYDPQHRYQTPGTMAADLERFLSDEPIAARRISPLERLIRWARKHPALASATGAIAALLFMLAVASIFWWRAAESRSQAVDALNQQQQHELSDQKSRLNQANSAAVLMQSFLEPMVESTRLSQQIERKNNTALQMRAIATAVQNFDTVHHRLPADIVAADGTPLLSWRVEILPFLPDQTKLYDSLRQNEPWNSPHNQALLAQIPDCFAPVVADDRADTLAQGIEVARRASRPATAPAGGFEPGQSMEALQLDLTRRMVDFIRRESAAAKPQPEQLRVDRSKPVTYFQAFQGPMTLFDGQNLSLAKVFDGSNTTILLVEAAQPVPWTKPGGLKFNPAGDLPAFGGLGFQDEFAIAMLDGSIHFVPKDISREILKKMITPSGSEEVPLDWQMLKNSISPTPPARR